ncbi:RNA polymerase sigma factor SigZ [Arcicella sp. LKC2W]|uniref:RNA polymerase sigma factor SigZ n=1 Tax=Arcicella sp. LKC2W TaxID=2984198 RepID=UPI002B1ECA6F|nr:RNA polymerase sigma factor SigZ [Arcicella sp. LKC2W]MEA5459443.1 RNA polymerase sigma factor SigZ [Arcicella sp. LKC2W]
MTETSEHTITFNEIWLKFSHPVKDYIRKQTQNADITDDLLQDVFIKIHQNLHLLREEERVAGWVFQIARNTVLNYFRSKKRQLEDNELTDIEKEDEPFKENNFNEMVGIWLKEFKKDLDPKYQEALQLVDIEGISQVELAHRLGISVSGAKSRVQRGREQLKQKLIDCCPVKTDQYGNILEIQTKTGECLC